jgi:hypothetical protein
VKRLVIGFQRVTTNLELRSPESAFFVRAMCLIPRHIRSENGEEYAHGGEARNQSAEICPVGCPWPFKALDLYAVSHAHEFSRTP